MSLSNYLIHHQSIYQFAVLWFNYCAVIVQINRMKHENSRKYLQPPVIRKSIINLYLKPERDDQHENKEEGQII